MCDYEENLTLKIDGKEYKFGKVSLENISILIKVVNNGINNFKDRLNEFSAAYKAYKEKQVNNNGNI